MERERVTEIFLGLIFIILLIIMILSFTSVSANSNKITITDSYNTYNIENSQTPEYVYDSYYDYNKEPLRYYKTNKPYFYENKYSYKSYNDYYSYDKVYYKNSYKYKKDYSYSSHKYEYSEGLFGSEINKYSIYVKNKENKAGYYTVKFYLRDRSGDVRVETVTHYLKPYYGKTFVYKNVFDDEYDYAWNYKVISH